MECLEVWGGNRATIANFQMPGLRVWLSSRPQGDSVRGGDVYYLSSCASGRITRALLADVSGHGESVAETAVQLRDLVRQNVNRIRQDRLVEKMNDRFGEVAARSGNFATAIVSTLFSPTRTITISIAGHPTPLIYRRSKKLWMELERPTDDSATSDLPLGVDACITYNQCQVKLTSGDRVLLYTDGLSEAMTEPGKVIGTHGLCAIANEIDNDTAEDFLRLFLERIEDAAGTTLNADDATALLLESTDSRVPFLNNVLAPFRFVRSLFSDSAINTTSPPA